jgi:hypothetical protein
MGLGIVVRDHTGAFLPACGERFDEVICPAMAEGRALRRVVSFSVNEGYFKVIFCFWLPGDDPSHQITAD